MDEQRRLLDSLMGLDRNKAKTAGAAPRFTEADVCKHYLCGLCPFETFMNTKIELGHCKLSHSDELKLAYEEARKTKDYGYELELYKELEKIIGDIDRKTKNAQRRLEHQQKEAFPDLAVDDPQNAEIAEMMARAEKLGEEGKVDESLMLMDQVNEIKRKKATNQDYQMPGVPFIEQKKQQLRVCDVCGSLLGQNDSDRRLQDHYAGRLHIGSDLVRKKILQIRDLLKLPASDPNSIQRNNRDRERERDRDTYRSSEPRERDRDNYRPDNRDSHRDSRDRDRDRDRDYRRERERDQDDRRDRDYSRDRDRRRDDRYDDRRRDDRRDSRRERDRDDDSNRSRRD